VTLRRRSQAGFSIAEVVVALGVLASVLISVAGMLVVANRLVRSGRGSSEALALARDLMEEMHSWGYRQTWVGLGCDPSMPVCECGDDDPALEPWSAMLQGELRDGSLTVRVEDLDPAGSLETSSGLRVTVTVRWTQDQRTREVSVQTVRI
jgi:hypothetical protein